MLVAAGVVVAVRPVVAVDRQVSAVVARNEAGALDRLAAIVEAQREYQMRDSGGLYACSFDDLDETFERREPEPPFRDTGWTSGYLFRLSCTDQTRTTFHLDARPERRAWNVRVPPTGETTFCTDETGSF